MADDPRIVSLVKRHEQLRAQRDVFMEQWRLLATYILPRRSSPLLNQSPGADQMSEVFDPTSIHANEILAARMHGSLTSSTSRWFRLRHRLEVVNNDPESQKWFDLCATILFKTLTASNFGSEGIETYLDLGGFGVGGTLMIENPDRPPNVRFGGFLFQSLSLGDYVIAESATGVVNTVMHVISMSVNAVFEQWGARAQQSAELVKLQESEPDTLVDVIHAVYPRKQDPLAPRDPKPYTSVYWLDTDKTLLSESGYWEFPALVPRWAKSKREVYGRGPGHSALPGILTLNRAVELNLRAWDKSIDPPLLAIAEGVLSHPRLTPGGITYVQHKEALTPLLSGARVDVTQIQAAELRAQIKETFYDSQLQLPNQPYMTAEEITRRWELMQQTLGPTLGRLESEWLGPMIRRGFLMLLRAGMLPPPPDMIRKASKAGLSELDIEYEGPLSRAMRYGDVQSVQRAIATIEPIAKYKPDVVDNFDLDKIARKVATDTGVSADSLRDPSEVQKMREARAKIQAMQMDLAQKQAGAQTARDASQAMQSAASAGAVAQETQSATPA